MSASSPPPVDPPPPEPPPGGLIPPPPAGSPGMQVHPPKVLQHAKEPGRHSALQLNPKGRSMLQLKEFSPPCPQNALEPSDDEGPGTSGLSSNSLRPFLRLSRFPLTLTIDKALSSN